MRTFNMGIGMVLVVPAKKFKRVQSIVEKAGEKAHLLAGSLRATARCSTPKHGSA